MFANFEAAGLEFLYSSQRLFYFYFYVSIFIKVDSPLLILLFNKVDNGLYVNTAKTSYIQFRSIQE